MLYDSGAGSTQLVAELLHEKLNEVFHVDTKCVDAELSIGDLYHYKVVIFGFATYHCAASQTIMQYSLRRKAIQYLQR